MVTDRNGLPPDPIVGRGLRTLMVRASLAALLVLLFIIAIGLFFDLHNAERVRAVIDEIREIPYAGAIAIVILAILNVAGLPLMALAAVAVGVFGPVYGFLYTWIASLIGGTVGYFLGHYFGSEILQRFGGERLNRISSVLAERGVFACMAVRWVPAPPALIVNVLIGTSHIGFWKFLVGTGLGIAPKLALVALLTAGIIEVGQTQNLYLMAVLGLLIAGWLVTMYFARRWIRGWWARKAEGEPSERLESEAASQPGQDLRCEPAGTDPSSGPAGRAAPEGREE